MTGVFQIGTYMYMYTFIYLSVCVYVYMHRLNEILFMTGAYEPDMLLQKIELKKWIISLSGKRKRSSENPTN